MDIENIEKSVKFSRRLVTSIFIITLASYIGWFFLSQGQFLSVKSADWGAFGDFVGGLLNPLIAYSAFYWLTVSVIVQKRELAETKQALIDSSKAQQEQVKMQAAQVQVQKELMIAQKEQVTEVYRSSAIEVISIRLREFTMKLESEHSYRNGVALNAMQPGGNAKTMSREGEIINSELELVNSNKVINELEAKHKKLMLKVTGMMN